MSGLPESLLQNIKFTNISVISKQGLIANYTTNLVINRYNESK